MKTRIVDVEVIPADIALREAFGIATGAISVARNAFVRITLEDGSVGTGEAAPFPPVTGETRDAALASLAAIRADFIGRNASAWRAMSSFLWERVAATPSAICAVETAVLDAWARSRGVALREFFGGTATHLESDLTITTGTTEAAATAAREIAEQGYKVIKLKVGGRPADEDADRLRAVIRAAPACGLLLDGNAALAGVEHALELVRIAEAAGGRVVLLEQPLAREDHAGQAELVRRSSVPVCADESAATVQDVLAIAQEKRAHVVNLKITKSGVVRAYDMAVAARATRLGLMIGGMVESAVATAMSAHLAAGFGGFSWVDLDTPQWLVGSPARGGYEQRGPLMDISASTPGHGATLALPASHG